MSASIYWREYVLSLVVLVLTLIAYLYFHVALGPAQTGQPDPKQTATKVQKPEAAEPLARVRMQVQTEPEAKSEAPPPAPRAEAVSVPNETAEKRGRETQQSGRLPTLIGQFRAPFEAYLRKVEGMGGRLVLYDRARREVTGACVNGRLEPVDASRFSLRSRDVTNDVPGALRNRCLAPVRQNGGPSLLLLALPSDLDARYWGVIAEGLRQRGIEISDADTVFVSYDAGPAGRMDVVIDSVRLAGAERKIDLRMVLWP